MRKIIVDKSILSDAIEKGGTKEEVAKRLGMCVTTFNKYCKEFGIIVPRRSCKGKERNSTRKFPYVNHEWLIVNWLNTDKSLNELSKDYNIPLSLLEYRASWYGMKKRYKHKIDESLLYDETNVTTCYLAGLLNSDGYFRKDVDGFSICLVGDDEKILLETLKSYYNSDIPVIDIGNKHLWCVNRIGIRKFFSEKFNINTQDKTFNTGVPYEFYSEDCAKAYIRGCFDGDGYIGNNKFRLSFCTASYAYVAGVANILNKYTGVQLKVRYEKRTRQSKSYPSISAAGRNGKTILAWLYSGDNHVMLRRKYNNYLNQAKEIV